MSSIAASPSISIHVNVAQFSERLQENRHDVAHDEKDLSKNTSENQSDKQIAEQRQLQSLKIRDREVRAHELAHVSVGGQYTSGASFTYEKGSDGVLYAVAGEVSIDTSETPGDPQATLEKAQVIQRAALAPAEPSSQDRAVAAAASAMAQKARAEIAQLQAVEDYTDFESNNTPTLIDETA